MLSVGIVGLPNVGKSTLFKILTKVPVDINNYPFCTIHPNIGIVPIYDSRIDQLAKISNSKKKIPPVVEFVDIAGLVKNAHKGEGLGNQFLNNIRNVDLICEVVRFFEADNIEHVEKRISPKDDIQIIETELILKDLDSIQKQKIKLEKKARGNDKEAQKILIILKKIMDTLNTNLPARKTFLLKEELWEAKKFNLLTMKPVFYIFNIAQKNHPDLSILEKDLPHLNVDIKQEEEILTLSKEEQKILNLHSQIKTLPTIAYTHLNLISFFTTGEEETRAWTIKKGTTAEEAGGKIHKDFQKKFIRAEVISFKDFIFAESYKKAREMGLIRLEGKNYLVQDGDIIIFKI